MRLRALLLSVIAVAVSFSSIGARGSISPLIISEFRLRGPQGENDEFIEIYNPGFTNHTVTSVNGTGYGVAASNGVLRFSIPNGTVIPPHGHYLGVGSSYSIGAYPAGASTATGNVTFANDIPDNAGIALFTNNLGGGSFSVANRMDAVGSTSEANTTYKKGTGYNALTPSSIDYSFIRDPCPVTSQCIGELQDTGNNLADFKFVDTDGNLGAGLRRLGTPGPENLLSPIRLPSGATPDISVSLLDSAADEFTAPNYQFDPTSIPASNATFGSATIRRKFTNNTGAPLTRLRFRILDITTFPSPSGIADLRPRTIAGVTVTTSGGDVAVSGTTLEQPPSQANGGGFNSTLSVTSISTGSPLAAGASVNVQFLAGFQQTGTVRFSIQVESLPAASSDVMSISMISDVITECESNNTSGTANVVSFPFTGPNTAIVTGGITAGDADYYSFTAPAGAKVWVATDTGGTLAAGATARDTVIRVLASDGTTVIEEDDDDGTGNGLDGTNESLLASVIAGRTLSAGGTYFIRVAAFNGTQVVNPYRLLIVVTPNPPRPEAGPNGTAATANSMVTSGLQVDVRSGVISPAADVDYYTLRVFTGELVFLSADGDPERDGTGTDLVVELRDESDILLLSIDSSVTGSLSDPAAEGAGYSISLPGTYYVKVKHFSASGTGSYYLMAARMPITASAPVNLSATAATPTSVTVVWTVSPGAAAYSVYRSSGGGVFSALGASATASFTDSTASANTAYLYKVRVATPVIGVFSAVDLATTVIFTDSTLTAGITAVKGVHVSELRTAVNAVRVLAGLSAFLFTDPSLTVNVTGVKVIHISDLRTAIDAARSVLSLSALSYTGIAAGVSLFSPVHLNDLRGGVR